MKIQIEDTVYEGTAAGIMEQLRNLSFDPTEFPDVETYIWFAQNNVIRTTVMDCPLPDGDAETQAAAALLPLRRKKAILSTDCCGSSRKTVNSLWIGMRGIPATTRKKP